MRIDLIIMGFVFNDDDTVFYARMDDGIEFKGINTEMTFEEVFTKLGKAKIDEDIPQDHTLYSVEYDYEEYSLWIYSYNKKRRRVTNMDRTFLKAN